MSKTMRRTIAIIAVVLTAIMLFGLVGCGPKPTTYSITVVNGTGGGTYDKDASVTVTATVPEDKLFENWTAEGNVVSTDNPYIFTATKDITLTANFKERPLNPLEDVVYYTVVVDGGIVVDAEGGTQFKKDDSITVRAVPPAFTEFNYWTVDGQQHTDTPEFTHTVTGNIKFTAVYTAVSRYDLTLEGCVSESEYINGVEFVTVTANQTENYMFTGWTINGETVAESSPYTFELTEDTVVIANFKRVNITVTATSTNDDIEVTVTGGNEGIFEEGDTVTVAAATRNGISVTWRTPEGQSVSTQNPYVFDATDDIELVAHFGTIYTVSVENAWIGNDAANPLTSDVFGANTEARVNPIIPEGYMFLEWVDDQGNSKGVMNPYIFTVTANTVLIAVFKEIPEDATTYIFEAENADLSKCLNTGGAPGSGGAVEAHGDRNYGSSVPDPSVYKASNGYCAANFNNHLGNEITWTINSDVESTATLVIRMGSGSWDTAYRNKSIDLAPDKVQILLNNSDFIYSPLTVEGRDLTDTGADSIAVYGMFSDYIITTELPLAVGPNTFTVKLLTMGYGPNIDCIKLTTTANLTWTPRTNGNAPIAEYPWNVF